jgi:hypothetical protein
MLRITVRNHPWSGATRTLLPNGPGSYCGGQLATPGADQVIGRADVLLRGDDRVMHERTRRSGRGADPAARDDLKDRPTPQQESPGRAT